MAFWDKWFGKSGKEKQAIRQAQLEAERARRLQQAALTNPVDSENSRLAAERRLRRIGAMRGMSGQRTGQGGNAQTTQKTLLGN